MSDYSVQTHTLSGPSLAQLANLFVDAIKVGKMGSGKTLELFPTVLTALAACEVISYGKGKSFQGKVLILFHKRATFGAVWSFCT